MSLENAVCFSNINQPESWKIENYMASGGYLQWKKILQGQPGDKARQKIVEIIKTSGLRGRGGAGFPTGLKWSFMPKTTEQKYLVCNSDESEPGTCHDREILKLNPHAIIEGMAIAGFAMDATVGYHYVRGEFIKDCYPIVEFALQEAYTHNLLGKNILGSGVNFDLYNFLGAGAYICGEETGLLESLEGKKGMPRFKPPFPAQFGAFGRPTTVNNTETLASLPPILRNGPDWFKNLGTDGSGGTKIFSVSGHVKRPGNFEVTLGTPFRELLDFAGGLFEGRTLKAVIPGGSSMPVMPAEAIMNCNMDYDSLQAAGSMVGSGGVIVMDDTTCMVQVLERIAYFYFVESCGQCTPCREGTGWLYRTVHRIRVGRGRTEDLDLLESVAGRVEGRTICALGDAAAWPVQSFLKHFRIEFESKIKTRKAA